MRLILILLLASCISGGAQAQQLFVGLESDVPAYISDLTGFPDLNWAPLWSFGPSGAAADPQGNLYLCKGAFTTYLYRSTDLGEPVSLVTLDKDITALAYGRGALYGYSNYATPKGIYQIDPDTGVCTLVLDVHTDTGFRFFGLGYNPDDDLFYGFTEYGASGLYSIDIDTGEMIRISTGPVSWYGMSRGLTVGDGTVYLTGVNGAEDPYFAYDLSQGSDGAWIGFTNPYPGLSITGAAAWIAPTVVRTESWSFSRIKSLFR
jgi:hypothetical protein